jgi:hypothetical protein
MELVPTAPSVTSDEAEEAWDELHPLKKSTPNERMRIIRDKTVLRT